MSGKILLLFLFTISSTTAHASSQWLDTHNLLPLESGTIAYHVGPVLSPVTTVHIIWYGNWRPAPKRIIRDFIESISATNIPSPSVSEWWKTIQQYGDQTFSNVTKTVRLGREKNDRLLSQGPSLTRHSIQLVINSALKARTNPLPTDPKGGLYLVLTSDEILVQDFCKIACGYHFFTFPSLVGYTLPYAWVGNSEKLCPTYCAYPFARPFYMPIQKPVKSPNGELGVDAMVSVIAHEIAELATNPLLNSWYAGDNPSFPVEVADACEGTYGPGGGSGYIGEVRKDRTGAVYNMNGVRRKFLVQWVWDHIAGRCSGPVAEDDS